MELTVQDTRNAGYCYLKQRSLEPIEDIYLAYQRGVLIFPAHFFVGDKNFELRGPGRIFMEDENFDYSIPVQFKWDKYLIFR